MDGMTLFLLWGTGVTAGFVDAIAGGGGILTVPVLLSVGLPPHLALGTNKLQSMFGSGTATLRYASKGLIDSRGLKTVIGATALGAVLGTWGVQQVDASGLKIVLPWFLLALLVYSFLAPNFGENHRPSRCGLTGFGCGVGLGLGFYDGFFGPGTGSFWTMAYILLLGKALTEATAHTKVVNFTSNVVSFVVFALAGQVVWGAGLLMGVGQIMGAWLGAHYAIRQGVGFIRWIFRLMVLATVVKLFWMR